MSDDTTKLARRMQNLERAFLTVKDILLRQDEINDDWRVWRREAEEHRRNTDAHIAVLGELLVENAQRTTENNKAIAENNKAIAENSKAIAELRKTVAVNAAAIAELRTAQGTTDIQVQALTAAVDRLIKRDNGDEDTE